MPAPKGTRPLAVQLEITCPVVVFCFGILRTGEIRWQAADFSPA